MSVLIDSIDSPMFSFLSPRRSFLILRRRKKRSAVTKRRRNANTPIRMNESRIMAYILAQSSGYSNQYKVIHKYMYDFIFSLSLFVYDAGITIKK